jgi:3-hydroxyisobutyrate dehydrogenase-like beta-hydroxyacid dehydrogenase
MIGAVAKLGLLHPGEMGSAVGRQLVAGGHEVLWASAGRSAQTWSRAGSAGFSDRGDLLSVATEAEVILSICPPHAADDVASRTAEAGFPGLYVDANAVSPATSRALGSRFGERFVDGGIVGPPPDSQGTTRLYLCGPHAAEVAALFRGTTLEAVVLEGEIGRASALKAAYAAWTKGSAALLIAVRDFAREAGVEPALLAEWALSQPGLTERSATALQSSAPKAWRWVGEMEEIAAAFAAQGLPDGFHTAAAAVFQRLSSREARLASSD